MDKINQLIKWCEEHNTRKEYILIKARLKMIRTLCEELSSLDNERFVEEIVAAFSEIINIQQEIIDDMKMEHTTFLVGIQADAKTKENKDEKLNSYLPVDGEFQTEQEIVKSFSNYLRYHHAKKLSKFTAYDYCSRVKNLWAAFIVDIKEGRLVEAGQYSNEKVISNSPLLNSYNNINVLLRYVNRKLAVLEKGSTVFKNMANARAALNRFDKFRCAVEANK